MKRQMFIAHVFNTEYMEDFRNCIHEVCKKLDIIPNYADDIVVTGHILQDKIFHLINNAELCLFEISETQKPNTFIELGYSLGRKKPSVLVLKQGIIPPSDLAGIDRIEYSSYNNLKSNLLKYIPRIINKIIFVNPKYKTSNGFKALLFNHRIDHEGMMMGADIFKDHIPHVSRWTKELVSILNSQQSVKEKTDQIDKYLAKLEDSFKDPILIDMNKENRYWLARSYKIVEIYLDSVRRELN